MNEELLDEYDRRFGYHAIPHAVLKYLRGQELLEAAIAAALRRGSPVTAADLPDGAQLVPDDVDILS